MEMRTKTDFAPPRAEAAFAGVVRGKLPASFESVSALVDLQQQYPDLADLDEGARKRFIATKVRERTREHQKTLQRLEESRATLGRLRREDSALKEVIDWCEALTLERAEAPRFHAMRKAFANGDVFSCPLQVDGVAAAYEVEIFRNAEAFVIEHDWAKAFDASDMKGAPFKLPYDVCAFEFRFSGRAVIALAVQAETEIAFSIAIETAIGWALIEKPYLISGATAIKDERFCDISKKLATQIRAICIALEAEVARSETVREKHTGEPRSGYAPPRAYHVVSLTRRALRTLPASGSSTGRRVRLHFRRGHWRHFEAHKTWIKWMLVGDPELGFIDKHYKL